MIKPIELEEALLQKLKELINESYIQNMALLSNIPFDFTKNIYFGTTLVHEAIPQHHKPLNKFDGISVDEKSPGLL